MCPPTVVDNSRSIGSVQSGSESCQSSLRVRFLGVLLGWGPWVPLVRYLPETYSPGCVLLYCAFRLLGCAFWGVPQPWS